MLPNTDMKHDNEGTTKAEKLDIPEDTTRQIVTEALQQEWTLARKREEDIRNDPLLRLCMIELIHHMNELVMDYAGLLAMKRGDDGWFNMDRCAVDILWQLNEYLGQCHIHRNDDPTDVYMALAKPHQLTRDHAADWFDVPMIMVEGHKGFVPGFHPDEFNSSESPLIWSV